MRRASLRSLDLVPLALILLSVLIACASPRDHLYTLESPRDEATGDLPPVAQLRGTVVIGPVSLPELVDRPELVVREGQYGIVTLEQQRWAAPLKESLPRVLAGELTRRIPTTRFVAASSAAINVPTARLLIAITRFDVARSGGAQLDAHWVYRPTRTDSAALEGDVTAHENVTGTGYEGYVEALRRASTRLAGGIADGLRKDM